MSDQTYCRSRDPFPAVVEVLDGDAYRLALPEGGSLTEQILLCIVHNGSVSPTEVGCKTDMPKFLSATFALVQAGYPISFRSGRHVRWGWAWRLDYSDDTRQFPLLISATKAFRLDKLRDWAVARVLESGKDV